MESNTSLSFEVSFSEAPLADPPKLTPKTNKKTIQSLDDIEKKLEEASDRRNDILSETKVKNSEHLQKVVSLAQAKRQGDEEKVTTIRENLEMDIAIKSKRREQILEAKIDFVRKKMDKVALRHSFCEESVNKENSEERHEKLLDRLNDAVKRRIQSIEDKKLKNSEKVKHAIEVSEREKARREERLQEIRHSVEKDVFSKAERREDQLKMRVESAKKYTSRVSETRARRSLVNSSCS